MPSTRQYNFIVHHEKDGQLDRQLGGFKHYLVYIEAGTSTYHTPEQTLTFSAGDFFYFPKNMPFTLDYKNCIAHSCGFVAFPEAVLTPFPPQLLPRKFLSEFMQIPKNGFPDCLSMSRLYQLLHKMLPQMITASEQPDTRSGLLMKIYYYVWGHHDCTIEQIAERCGMSAPTLYRTLRKKYNKSPNQIKQEVLVDVACGLLRDTDHSVQEISRRVCFCNANYFSRVFRQQTGMTPTGYRDRYKNNS